MSCATSACPSGEEEEEEEEIGEIVEIICSRVQGADAL